MAYVPKVDNDIFISYRHAANEGEDRWVDEFCKYLQQRLKDLVGNINIWKDNPELRAGDQWRPEIAKAIDSTAIFLAIISRTYFDSDVCRSEFDQFLGKVKEAAVEAKRRIVPVYQQPSKPDQDLPCELAEIDHHKFFELDPPNSSRFREFRLGRDKETEQRFWVTFEQLAQDLMYSLEMLKSSAYKHALGTVYLSSVGPELRADRVNLRTDLLQRGYLVVPEGGYIWNAADCRKKIIGNLEASELCIHQIARRSLLGPATIERAKCELEEAVKVMKRKGRQAPIVWIQPGSETDSAAQELVDYIAHDLSDEYVEYSEGSLEDFKTLIYDKLLARRASGPVAPSASAVGLIFDEGDLMAAEGLSAFLVDTMKLEQRRIKIATSGVPDSSSLAAELAHCGDCIIFWGARPEAWVSDLLSLVPLTGPAQGRRTCIYAAAPESTEKKTFRTNKAMMLRENPGVPEAELRQFLRSAGGH